MEITVKKHTAETIQINHPEASYAIFCFNESGDLFVNSDWGFYGYSWRAYGDDFKEFLSKLNADYIVGKFSINHREVSGKKMYAAREKNLTILAGEFIKILKADLAKQD